MSCRQRLWAAAGGGVDGAGIRDKQSLVEMVFAMEVSMILCEDDVN